MRRIEIDVCQYDDLEPEAQAVAREWYQRCGGTEYTWGAEALATLHRFAEVVGIHVRNYSLGGSDNRRQGVKYDLRERGAWQDLEGVRLWRYLQNNDWLLGFDQVTKDCNLTGYCLDYSICKPLRDFIDRPTVGATWSEIVRDCIEEFCAAYAQDVDDCSSEESIVDSIRANEYEFLPNGEKYNER